MKKKIFYLLLSVGFMMSVSSCEKYLDVLPDNRAELNTKDKISKLLVSAYPENSYVMLAELSSDNVDDYGETNPNSSRFLEEIFTWKDITESNNDGIDRLWSACYGSIASANAALQAIEEEGNPADLSPQKGEALVARAYSHWILVNMFALNYNKTSSATDLGVTYMFKSETTLDPKYTRNNVKEVYDFMIKDLEEGLPLISDNAFTNSNTAKYHMNRSAAYTFAARVALFMEDWAKARDYATLALNNNPSEFLRDNAYINKFSASWSNTAKEYNSSTLKANFMIATAYSTMGRTFGGYTTNSRYNYGAPIALTEGAYVPQPYGYTNLSSQYRIRGFNYTGTNLNKYLFPRVSYLFEYTDQVAGIGYNRGLYTPLTAEEAILTRAEANIHLNNNGAALSDMQIFVNNNTILSPEVLSETSINTWANAYAYYTPVAPTPKKKLNSTFAIATGTQENMLHAVLNLRRFHFLHTGMRWFDVKRYGIEISRRVVVDQNLSSLTFREIGNELKKDDPRRAIQLPQDVISAGLTPNPR